MFKCIACQPIFNRNLNVYGYELLYRKNEDSVSYDAADGNRATRDVIATAFTDIGIEEITGGRKAFINFTSDLILDEVPNMLSNKVLVVELLEEVRSSEPIINACRKLKQKGYILALDDFVYSEENKGLIELVDIIKIDFQSMGETGVRDTLNKLRRHPRKIILAEKIETQKEFELALSLGFSLFQGYFFSKPILKSGRRADTRILSRMQLLNEIAKPELDFHKLADIIRKDVVMSYRLLKIVNSAYYGLRYSINNILHALVMLGVNESRKWISLILLSDVSGSKPDELIRMAFIRGMFMEKIALHLKKRKNKDDYFMSGLFSLAGSIFDVSLDIVLSEINLTPEITAPLLTGVGEVADFIKVVLCLETAEWDNAVEIAGKYGIPHDQLHDIYFESIKSANELL